MNTREIIVVVQLRLDANHRDEFLRTLYDIVERSRIAPECLSYELFSRAEDENTVFSGAVGSAILTNVKSWSLVLYRDGDFTRFTAETNVDVLSGVLMISVNDRVCEGFAQCDLNPALALRNTAALPEQEHEPIHEGRNRSHFAWQRAL
jgi:hypothetical protein